MLEDSKGVTARGVEEEVTGHFYFIIKCCFCLLQHRSYMKGMKLGVDKTLIVEQLRWSLKTLFQSVLLLYIKLITAILKLAIPHKLFNSIRFNWPCNSSSINSGH